MLKNIQFISENKIKRKGLTSINYVFDFVQFFFLKVGYKNV